SRATAERSGWDHDAPAQLRCGTHVSRLSGRWHQAGDLARSAHWQDYQAIFDAGRLGSTGLSDCRSASWYWRCPTDSVSIGALNGWCDCLHAPGCGARGRVARLGNVAYDAGADSGSHRKHELFSLSPLSGQDRYFRSWRGAESRRGLSRTVSWCAAARPPKPPWG